MSIRYLTLIIPDCIVDCSLRQKYHILLMEYLQEIHINKEILQIVLILKQTDLHKYFLTK